MIALLIFGILLMIAGLVLFFLQPKLKEYERRSAKLWSNVIGAVGTLIVLLSLVFGSLTTIPAGYVGIVTRFQGDKSRVEINGKVLARRKVNAQGVLSFRDPGAGKRAILIRPQ